MSLNSLTILGSSTTTSGTAVAEIVPLLSTDKINILEIRLVLNAPTSASPSVFGFGIPAAEGIGRSLTSPFQTEDMSTLSSTCYLENSWTTGPTAPTVFLRRCTMANTTGSSCGWNFPNGLVVTPQTSLVIWNLTNNDIPLVDVLVDE